MAKKARKTTKQTDEAYFLKLVMYMIIGSQWLRIENIPEWSLPVPLGLMIGMWFAHHEHFQIDRKIEYALLLVAAFIGFWLPLGLVIKL